MSPFEMHVESHGDVATIVLRGELDVVTAPDLRDTIVRLVSEGCSTIVFDCSALGFIDSTGLGVLIGARACCVAANGKVSLTGVKPALHRLLVVTGIDGLFGQRTAAA